MLEYIYKLKFPTIEEISIPNEFQKLVNDRDLLAIGHKYVSAKTLIKPEYTKINGVHFENVQSFFKNNKTGTIHFDDNETPRYEDEFPVWGINWVHGGPGQMEYWQFESLDVCQRVPDAIGDYMFLCQTSKPADKVYNLEPGFAYLVNASLPHRATSFGKRYAFALRPDCRGRKNNILHDHNMLWSDVVDLFSNLITN